MNDSVIGAQTASMKLPLVFKFVVFGRRGSHDRPLSPSGQIGAPIFAVIVVKARTLADLTSPPLAP